MASNLDFDLAMSKNVLDDLWPWPWPVKNDWWVFPNCQSLPTHGSRVSSRSWLRRSRAHPCYYV